MNHSAIAGYRLRNHLLLGESRPKPEDVVGWLCAVQSQDYTGAKWGVAQRTKDATSADIDQAFDEGRLLRTHVLRPTWHFVLPKDIRWLQALTGPRVHAANAYYYRKLELDAATFRRGRAAITKALRGGAYLTRAEIAKVCGQAGIAASGMRLAYLVMHAELEGLVCSGPLRGKQFTYALLEERVPRTRSLDRDEALAALTRRYFTSHGPALAQDFAWWSGLTLTDVKVGIEMVKPRLEHESLDGKTYWFAAGSGRDPAFKPPLVHLLPNYDEYLIAYKDHTASFGPNVMGKVTRNAEALQAHIVVLNGGVIGGWRLTVGRKEIVITTDLLVRLSKAERAALGEAGRRYASFAATPTNVQ